MRREVASADGTVVSYDVYAGALPAVVILHGLAGSGREFEPTALALDGREVVLIDQRGHGFSTSKPVDVSRGAFVADVVRVIETEKVGPVDLVGQSMGAHTAMLVAAARPDLVSKLVLLEGNEGGGSPEESKAIGDFFQSWSVPYVGRTEACAQLGDGPLAQAWVADLEERANGLYPRFDPDVMEEAIRVVAVPRLTEWRRVTAPALVLYADGGIFTEEQKQRFVTQGNNVIRVDLVGASHDAHLDAFDQWTEALTSFVDSR